MRRGKALFFSGCESRPVTFVPTGSNRSRRGGNESSEAFGVEGSSRNLATLQAVMLCEHCAGLEKGDTEADPPVIRGRPQSQVKRTKRAACGSVGVLVTACREEEDRRNTGSPDA